MNLILFEANEIDRPLPREDFRAHHILEVLRRSVGEEFDVGITNGPRGKARLIADSTDHLDLGFTWSLPHASPPSTRLMVGMPRPQTARDILRDATSMGVSAIEFVRTLRSDANYAKSSLWSSGEWRRHIRNGAAQAFATGIPNVSWDQKLPHWGEENATTGPSLLVVDVYGGHPHLGELTLADPEIPCTVCIGPERGWDDQDRRIFRDLNSRFFTLGDRVLRTETAVIATLSILGAARARAGR